MIKSLLPLLLLALCLSPAGGQDPAGHASGSQAAADEEGPMALMASLEDVSPNPFDKYEVVGCMPVTTHVLNDHTESASDISQDLCVGHCLDHGLSYTALIAVPPANVECACLMGNVVSGNLSDCNVRCRKTNETCGGATRVQGAFTKPFYTILRNPRRKSSPDSHEATTPAGGQGDAGVPPSATSTEESSERRSSPEKREAESPPCQPGYKQVQNKCVDIDECVINQQLTPLCAPNALCVNLDGTFGCICKSGYNGDGFKECDDAETDPLKMASHIEATARLNGVFTDALYRPNTDAFQSLNRDCVRFFEILAHKVDSSEEFGGAADCVFMNGTIIAYTVLSYRRPINVQDITESVKHFLGRGDLRMMGSYPVVNFYVQEYVAPPWHAPASFEVANLVALSQTTATIVMGAVACVTLFLIVGLYIGSKVYQRRTRAARPIVRELKDMSHTDSEPSTSAAADTAAASNAPRPGMQRQTSIKDMLRIAPGRGASVPQELVRFMPGKKGQKYSHVDSDDDDDDDDDQALEIQTQGLVIDGPRNSARDDDELLP